MFIDRTMHVSICAPAERDVSGNGKSATVSLRWSEEGSFGFELSINIKSLRDEEKRITA
jgi:hypothetical protein